MLLTCSSCKSRYLVNSADLKPNGRTVRCASCGNEWFQDPNLVEEEIIESPTSNTFTAENNKFKPGQNIVSNLPSTYIREEKTSTINSILVVLFLIIIFVLIWFIKNEKSGIIILLNFYIQEFYFNLKLIINDLAQLIHQIIN